MPALTFKTVTQILTQVAPELGLCVASDVNATTAITGTGDANQHQLYFLLRALGRKLVLEYPWLQTVKEHTFSTTATTTFSLPTDFYCYLEDTGWNRTTRQPLVAVTPQRWQALKAASTTGVLYVIFRPRERAVEFLNTATASQTVAFEYQSIYWVGVDDAATIPTLETVSDAENLVMLDSHLVERGLKLAFLQAKGLPAAAAEADFLSALNACRGVEGMAAPVLTLDRPRVDAGVFGPNVPETGFGA